MPCLQWIWLFKFKIFAKLQQLGYEHFNSSKNENLECSA